MMNKKLAKRLLSVSLCAAIGLSSMAFDNSSKAYAATEQSLEVISTGKEFLGTKYKFGAPSGVTYAFDCSSFTQYVFKQFDIELPRTSSAQAKAGEKVDRAYLSVGDLVFYNINGNGISHVAIYAGDNKILHTSSSKGVAIADMNSDYWKKAYVTARRVL
ncbi:C40 family peptidase [Paenibacillus tarimensis]